MGYAPHPVHLIYIQSKLVTGFFPVTVCPALLVQGITLLMVNDVAGKVTPALDVLDVPQSSCPVFCFLHVSSLVRKPVNLTPTLTLSLSPIVFGCLPFQENLGWRRR